MLPPGLLERLELVAELRPGVDGGTSGEAHRITLPSRPGAGFDGPRAAAGGSGDPRSAGRGPTGRPEPRGRRGPARAPAAAARARGARPPGPRLDLDRGRRRAALGPVRSRDRRRRRRRGARLGPRQRALLDELDLAGRPTGCPAPELAARHGSSAVATLARRGLVTIDVREAPRQPLATRPVGRRGSRPAAASSARSRTPPSPPSSASRQPAARARSCSTG